MQIVRIKISNFRGIASADLLLPAHAVLIGDNNVGKSTVLEAIDLCLGPDRLSRIPPIDEHDFHLGQYFLEPAGAEEPAAAQAQPVAAAESPIIDIELTITALSDEQQDHFADHVEWWNAHTSTLYEGGADGL